MLPPEPLQGVIPGGVFCCPQQVLESNLQFYLLKSTPEESKNPPTASKSENLDELHKSPIGPKRPAHGESPRLRWSKMNCKPSSVSRPKRSKDDGHSSKRPTRGLFGHFNAPLFGLAPSGVYTASSVTRRAVRSYRTISHLPYLRKALYFLLH